MSCEVMLLLRKLASGFQLGYSEDFAGDAPILRDDHVDDNMPRSFKRSRLGRLMFMMSLAWSMSIAADARMATSDRDVEVLNGLHWLGIGTITPTQQGTSVRNGAMCISLSIRDAIYISPVLPYSSVHSSTILRHRRDSEKQTIYAHRSSTFILKGNLSSKPPMFSNSKRNINANLVDYPTPQSPTSKKITIFIP